MKNNKTIYRIMAGAFVMFIALSTLSGCTAKNSRSARLADLEQARLMFEELAQEEELVKPNDPQRAVKHKKRRKRYRRKEMKRLNALADRKELQAELAAEQWWIDKELETLQLADDQREWENKAVEQWREEEEKRLEIERALRKKGPVTLEQTVLDSLGMVYVKGGCFDVGEPIESKDAIDVIDDLDLDRQVCVDDFYVGKHEITAGEFHEFVKETSYITDAERDGGCYLYTGNTWYNTSDWKRKNTYHWKNTSFSQDVDHPVACVSWHDANEFAEWRSRKHGINYRLPTEAEWEYAASGGEYYREKWSGTNDEEDVGVYAWHSNNSDNKTHPVGQKKPNKLGIFDMSGNVWEWVQDSYDHHENPMANSKNKLRVIRGGSWYSIHTNLSTDRRFKHLKPNYRDFASGFRLGLDGRIKLDKASSLR